MKPTRSAACVKNCLKVKVYDDFLDHLKRKVIHCRSKQIGPNIHLNMHILTFIYKYFLNLLNYNSPLLSYQVMSLIYTHSQLYKPTLFPLINAASNKRHTIDATIIISATLNLIIFVLCYMIRCKKKKKSLFFKMFLVIKLPRLSQQTIEKYVSSDSNRESNV